MDATPPWARTPVCKGQPWIPSLPKSSVFALLLEPWTRMDKVSERAVFFPYDWIVVTQLHCAALKHQCSLPSGSPCRLLQDCIHHILLHPFSLRPCERSRQLIVEDPEGGLSHAWTWDTHFSHSVRESCRAISSVKVSAVLPVTRNFQMSNKTHSTDL